MAAAAVMAFHYLFNGIANGKVSSISHIPGLIEVAKYGYLGVDFFFIISGYVIFFSAQGKSAGEFASSRAARIFPAFWFAVPFTALFASIWGGPQMGVTLSQVLVNLTMVPNLFGVAPVDGVYWTLAYELGFYLLVLLCLMAGLKNHLSTLFLFWPALMLLAWLLGQSHRPLLGGYYAYFAAGTIFAIMRRRMTLPALAALLVCLFLCIDHAITQGMISSRIRNANYSALVIGSLIVVQFACFFLLNSAWGQSCRLPFSRQVGALTYPIYLVHAHFGYMLLSRFATDENKALVYPLVAALVMAIAFFIHWAVEKRLAAFWKQFFNVTVGKPLEFLAPQRWFRTRGETGTA